MSVLSRLNRPWLHFIFLGALLYYVQGQLFPTPKPVIGPLATERIEALREQRFASTRRPPTDEQVASLRFAELVCKHVKSNAIVIAKGRRILGVGAGQMSRVDSVRLAVEKSGDEVGGSVLASDAFFPFPDGVETAMEAGVTAILQPGGSIRDAQVVEACDARGVPMVLTGVRHFRH